MNTIDINKIIVLIFIFLLYSSYAIAQLKLPAIIIDNLVLQAGVKNPNWGWATPEQKVTVSIQGKTKSTVTNTKGFWKLELEKLIPNGDPLIMTIHTDKVDTVENILIGAVCLCSGQSNMLWPLAKTNKAQNDLENANQPENRLFKVPLYWIGHTCK